MTYESPITLITTQTDNYIKEINEKTDEVIFKAVVNVLPQVNKEELIKALAYDRGQYLKGYKDRDSEIVRCKDCRFAEHGTTMAIEEIDKTPRHYIDWIKCHNYDIHKGVRFVKEDDFCSWAERREQCD